MEFEFGSIDFNLYLFDLTILGLGVYFLLKKFVLPKQAERILHRPINAWDITWTDFFLVLWGLLFSLILSQVLLNQVKPNNLSLAWDQILLSGTTHGVTILFLYSLKYFNIQSFSESLNSHTASIWGHIKNGLIYFLISVPLIWLTSKLWMHILELSKFLGLPVETPNQELVKLFTTTQDTPAIVIMSIIAVIIAPVAEELIFRAGIYRYLKGKTGSIYALLISSLLFSILHFNVLSLFPLFILGILLCRSYEKSGNITTSIFFHAFFNLNTLIHLAFEKLESM